MKAVYKSIIEAVKNFVGEKTVSEIKRIRDKVYVRKMVAVADNDMEAVIKLSYIEKRLDAIYKIALNSENKKVVFSDTIGFDEKLQAYYEKHKHITDKNDLLGKLKIDREETEELGKIVDKGEINYHKSRGENYWSTVRNIKLLFDATNKEIRRGVQVPKEYLYADMDFLQKHYNLKGIEFGNWLSQQDRANYIAGLGLSLFDLHHILGFSPKMLSLKGKIGLAFGARGRGDMPAHFETDTFIINITRYKRPKAGDRKNMHKLLTASGGVGSFGHEFGHALDYYAAYFIEKKKEAISGGRSLRTKPDKRTMNYTNLSGLMERLLNKIIWEKPDKHTDYYKRLLKLKQAGAISNYFLRRNEIFARAFESYIHYRMQQKKYYNLFLAESKYDTTYYLSPAEIRKLSKDFDALVNGIKNRI